MNKNKYPTNNQFYALLKSHGDNNYRRVRRFYTSLVDRAGHDIMLYDMGLTTNIHGLTEKGKQVLNQYKK